MMKYSQKLGRLRPMNVAVLQVVVEADVSMAWRQRQSDHRRQPIPSVPSILHRRLTRGSPGPSAKGLQHKAAFVEKNHASLATTPPFLSAANLASANEEWFSRRAPAHAALVSDKSNPMRARFDQHVLRGRSRQSTVRSRVPHEGMSTDRSESQMPAHLLPRKSPALAFVAPSGKAYGQDVGGPPNLPNLIPSACLSIVLRKRSRHARSWPPRECPCLRVGVVQQSDVVPLVLPCFL